MQTLLQWGPAIAVLLLFSLGVTLWRWRIKAARKENPAYDTLAASFYRINLRIKSERADLQDGLFRPQDAYAFATSLEEEAAKIRKAVELMPSEWRVAVQSYT